MRMPGVDVAKFMKKYGTKAKTKCNSVPEGLHPHMFRHSRAMHLYRGGMPLALLSEWLGHVQVETTMIYAYADMQMKRDAIEKATSILNPLLKSHLGPTWQDDEAFVPILKEWLESKIMSLAPWKFENRRIAQDIA